MILYATMNWKIKIFYNMHNEHKLSMVELYYVQYIENFLYFFILIPTNQSSENHRCIYCITLYFAINLLRTLYFIVIFTFFFSRILCAWNIIFANHSSTIYQLTCCYISEHLFETPWLHKVHTIHLSAEKHDCKHIHRHEHIRWVCAWMCAWLCICLQLCFSAFNCTLRKYR